MNLSDMKRKSYVNGNVIVVFVLSICALAFVLPAGTAELPGDPKQVAFEAIDRNADRCSR
jgi:hypothetical protein